jgi:hypothetical protein
MRRGLSGRPRALAGLTFSSERNAERAKMSLKTGVFIILICAAYAYVVFWYGFAIYGAIGER